MPKDGLRSNKKRQRFTPEQRRKMILDGAIEFFAENGFDGSTHQLAKHLEVTQPLIYQYFPTKDDLVEAVYTKVFRDRWNDEWDGVLSDRSRTLAERLLKFYRSYSQVTHEPTWIRIYLYAGLKNLELNRRYTPIVEERAIRRICIEARDTFGLPGLDVEPLRNEEFEAVWNMHGGIFYYGVRRHVYQLPIEASSFEVIHAAVTVYLRGLPGLAEDLGLG